MNSDTEFIDQDLLDRIEKSIEIINQLQGPPFKNENKDQYDNKNKIEQNKCLVRQVISKNGLCILLDGAQGDSSTALINVGFEPASIVAVSYSKEAYELHQNRTNKSEFGHLTSIHLVQRNIFEVIELLNAGSCWAVLYLDYTSTWEGNKTQDACKPARDVERIFRKHLPLNEGSLLMITICKSRRRGASVRKDELNLVQNVTKWACEESYTVQFLFWRRDSPMTTFGFRLEKKEKVKAKTVSSHHSSDGHGPHEKNYVGSEQVTSRVSCPISKTTTTSPSMGKTTSGITLGEQIADKAGSTDETTEISRRMKAVKLTNNGETKKPTTASKKATILIIQPRVRTVKKIQKTVESIKIAGLHWESIKLRELKCYLENNKTGNLLLETLLSLNNIIQSVEIKRD